MISKNTMLTVILILILVVVFLIFVSNTTDRNKTEVNMIPVPSMASPNAPKTYTFDNSTDLKKELDSINPQVLDSDFE